MSDSSDPTREELDELKIKVANYRAIFREMAKNVNERVEEAKYYADNPPSGAAYSSYVAVTTFAKMMIHSLFDAGMRPYEYNAASMYFPDEIGDFP